ncbi:hypothetical protein JHK82_047226 [Glycine max]|nr:hypothetical protein JHK82_047226 [Glycine max]
MLKGKLKLPAPDKVRRVFPDRLGSLVAGFDEKGHGIEGSEFKLESGKELKPIQPGELGFHIGSDDDDDKETKIWQRFCHSGFSVEELSQREINLEKLQRIASTGIPDGGGKMHGVYDEVEHSPDFGSKPKLMGNVEADRVSCFVRILGDSADHFCQQLDNSSSGILATLSRLSDLLKVNDEQLWRHFELRTKDMLLRICCAMLLCVKSKLLSGDFVTNLKLLQHYPDDINIEYLLQVAKDIRPDTSYYCLSL